MILDELHYATVEEIEPNIVEVIANMGVEVTLEDIELMEKGFLEKFTGPYAELVNRMNTYSHTHDSLEKACNLKNCIAVAILVKSNISFHAANIHKDYAGKIQVFMNRDEALTWLRAMLKKSI